PRRLAYSCAIWICPGRLISRIFFFGGAPNVSRDFLSAAPGTKSRYRSKKVPKSPDPLEPVETSGLFKLGPACTLLPLTSSHPNIRTSQHLIPRQPRRRLEHH